MIHPLEERAQRERVAARRRDQISRGIGVLVIFALIVMFSLHFAGVF